MPIVGKLLVNGRATDRSSCLSPLVGFELSNATPPMAVIANTSGGCTIGPKRLRLRTRHTAATQLTTNTI
jgi:hypothetical protein